MTVRNSSPANCFSFFTIQSNLFAAIVLLWSAFGDVSDRVRGAAVLYLSITFVVYGVLLAGYQQEFQTTTPWVDTVLHRVMPLVVIFDWLIVPLTAESARSRAAGYDGSHLGVLSPRTV